MTITRARFEIFPFDYLLKRKYLLHILDSVKCIKCVRRIILHVINTIYNDQYSFMHIMHKKKEEKKVEKKSRKNKNFFVYRLCRSFDVSLSIFWHHEKQSEILGLFQHYIFSIGTYTVGIMGLYFSRHYKQGTYLIKNVMVKYIPLLTYIFSLTSIYRFTPNYFLGIVMEIK